MPTLDFFIPGDPAPQGSKRHVGNGRMIEASKKVGPWRAAVASTVALLPPFAPFEKAVELSTVYYLPRPATVRRERPTVPPDLDKLDRGLWDALTKAGVWTDDSLVVIGTHEKRYADGHPTGAHVVIRELSPADQPLFGE